MSSNDPVSVVRWRDAGWLGANRRSSIPMSEELPVGNMTSNDRSRLDGLSMITPTTGKKENT